MRVDTYDWWHLIGTIFLYVIKYTTCLLLLAETSVVDTTVGSY